MNPTDPEDLKPETKFIHFYFFREFITNRFKAKTLGNFILYKGL